MARIPLLQLSGISLTFGGDPVFDGLDLVVHGGDRVALVGRNGSGKSTLMKVMAGLVEPDRGDVVVPPGRSVGYMEQDPDMMGFSTLGDFASAGLEPGELYKVERAGEGLKFDPARPVETASGGERRRAALARLMAAIPAPIANAMLAGMLLTLCLAPINAVAQMPLLALPILLAWIIGLRFARRYAVPIAVLVTGILLAATTHLPAGALDGSWPALVPVMPFFTLDAVVRAGDGGNGGAGADGGNGGDLRLGGELTREGDRGPRVDGLYGSRGGNGGKGWKSAGGDGGGSGAVVYEE